MKIITKLLRLKDCHSYHCCLVLISLAHRCEAQDSGKTITISIPTLLLASGFTLICICFCVYQCQIFQSRRNYNLRRYRQTIHNHNVRRISQIINTQSLSTSAAQPQSAQTSIPLYSSLNHPAQPTTSQTVPQASDPVFQPVATLHRGDAPTVHEEAIGSNENT